jgi:hypothetical protein
LAEVPTATPEQISREHFLWESYLHAHSLAENLDLAGVHDRAYEARQIAALIRTLLSELYLVRAAVADV